MTHLLFWAHWEESNLRGINRMSICYISRWLYVFLNFDFNVILGAHSYYKIQSLSCAPHPHSGPLPWGHDINILMCIFLDDLYAFIHLCLERNISFYLCVCYFCIQVIVQSIHCSVTCFFHRTIYLRQHSISLKKDLPYFYLLTHILW